jgi:hypothetical protein
MQYATAGKKTITVTVSACDLFTGTPSGEISAQTTVSFDAGNSPGLKAGAMLSGNQGPIAPQVIVSTDPGNPTMARAPLGRALRIDTFDQQGQPVSAAFSLSNQNVTQEGLDPNALFHDFVAFRYANPYPSEVSLQPIHLGSVLLTITPSDSSLPAGYIKLVVENPASLGVSHPEVDAMVNSIAHEKGIPPQYIKGQMEQESGRVFDRSAYRYEPLQGDVGDFGTISRGADYRSSEQAYSDYRMATEKDCKDDALLEGTKFLPGDLGRRSIYQICPNMQCRAIADTDTLIIAWDIITANPLANWQTKNRPNYNVVSRAIQRGDTCTGIWTAQTGLAASYGLLQVTYVTAIDTLQWKGVDGGDKNPSYLYDTAENLKIHGGSVELGAELVKQAAIELHEQDVIAPNFISRTDLENILLDGWSRYNNDPPYPMLVLARADHFTPMFSKSIFGVTQ